jgi:hypothetical protein
VLIPHATDVLARVKGRLQPVGSARMPARTCARHVHPLAIPSERSTCVPPITTESLRLMALMIGSSSDGVRFTWPLGSWPPTATDVHLRLPAHHSAPNL